MIQGVSTVLLKGMLMVDGLAEEMAEQWDGEQDYLTVA